MSTNDFNPNPDESDSSVNSRPKHQSQKAVRVQRIIDVSNGIDPQHSEIFSDKQSASSRTYKNTDVLYYTQNNKLRNAIPGFGMSKLRNINPRKLPELNTKYGETYFKRLKKTLRSEYEEDRGQA